MRLREFELQSDRGQFGSDCYGKADSDRSRRGRVEGIVLVGEDDAIDEADSG